MAKVPPLTDFKYELMDDLNGIKITAYEGEDVHIRIPDTIEDMPVVELGGYLFFNKNVEAVIMPDTIKNIQQNLNMLHKVALNIVRIYKRETQSKLPLNGIMFRALMNPHDLLPLLDKN